MTSSVSTQSLSAASSHKQVDPLFFEHLSDQKERIEAAMKSSFSAHLNSVEKAACYSLFLASKRLRPVLCLEVCRAFIGQDERAMPAAVALEMLHTYSLVHDDLPSMDNDDLRRGMPTNHRRYGEARAILAGDGLLTKSFEVLASSEIVSADVRVAWVKELAISAGMDGMVLGQDLDIHPSEKAQAESASSAAQNLEFLHRKKTGALIAAAAVMGAIAAEASSTQIEQVRNFAEYMGLAFQIQDDILDVVGGDEIGKPVNSDEKNDKTTYVSLLGLEAARAEGKKYYEKTLESLGQIQFLHPHRLEELARFVIERRV